MSNGSVKSRITIGILAEVNSEWMGGVNYIINFIKTLSLLLTTETPKLVIILNPEVENYFKEELRKYNNIQFELIYKPYQLLLTIPVLRRIISRIYRFIQIKMISKRYQIKTIFPTVNFLDVFFFKKPVAWIPDFQHLNFPDFFSKKEIKKRNRNITRLAYYCPYIIFSSNNSKSDFEKFFPDYKCKTYVYSFHTVLESEFQIKDFSYIKNKYDLPEKFMYLPNQFWIHKNHITVFKALARLLQQGHEVSLICTGSTSDYRNREHFKKLNQFIQNHQLSNIKVLGLIPREDQLNLYYYTHAVIQPSLAEGWSSIVEDAKAFNKTIILSDIPVHREQNPMKAVFFNPLDYKELTSIIKDIWGRVPEEKLSYQELCYAQEAKIKSTANDLLEFFTNI